ncbi:MAG: pyridoxamine 5'-phosphate oxidase family protein [Candidatus Omnitrophica bacterium]|nr:pyridoxamine 5'-phosphate oxidase family protein [Candidatus Omnitrophota bacterium]
MKKLSEEITHFFRNQDCVIVSTIDKNGFTHTSCKGLVKLEDRGRLYLLDLYKGRTYENLQRDPHLSITAIDEHKFIGYCLKGEARLIHKNELTQEIHRAWEGKIISRLTNRLLKNMLGEKAHRAHPEALLPNPEYLIVVDVEEIVDLTPRQLK